MSQKSKNPSTFAVAWPILGFVLLLIYGLFGHPQIFNSEALSLEVIILFATSMSCLQLLRLGYKWREIEKGIAAKVGEAIPIVLILFAIGVLIGSWIVSGTIPMLIYHGISLVSPDWIYLIAFVLCIIFSLLTGTSWGSAGTIGIVMIGIAEVYDANLAIAAAAVIGGSFFGDKMSPLSDTTNIAALACEVDVMDHIKSMLWTTGPAAILAAMVYFFLSPYFGKEPFNDSALGLVEVENTLHDLQSIFNFNIVLLLPLIFVLWGTMTRRPTVMILLGSAWLALILAVIFQDFSFEEIVRSCKSGFELAFVTEGVEVKSDVVNILNRGGMYNLIEGIVVSILIFAFIGTLEITNAIERSLEGIMKILNNARYTVVAALSCTWFINYIASNQYATSFVMGETFKKKFDKLGIKRNVLSRSIEDAGTMMENLVPWTPSGIFMASTLGVATWDYAPYQFMSLFNIVIAYLFALTGIAIFRKAVEK